MLIKSTGMVRRVDDLGRVVIPIEIRRHLNIEVKDPLEIFVEGEKLIIKKYGQNCVFCGSIEDLTPFHDKHICAACLKELVDAENKVIQ